MPFRCLDGQPKCIKYTNLRKYLRRIEILLAVSTIIKNSTLPAVIDISYLDMANFLIVILGGSHYPLNGTI